MRPSVVAGRAHTAPSPRRPTISTWTWSGCRSTATSTSGGGALADACSDDTILVVGSAPTYPHGVIDPITDIAALAAEHRGILCHVDACMGGFLLPFLDALGRVREPFDFRVPGVTSMSADVHKYGYAAKGVSVILYRTHELARKQLFVTTDWLGGFSASTAMGGRTRRAP